MKRKTVFIQYNVWNKKYQIVDSWFPPKNIIKEFKYHASAIKYKSKYNQGLI
jgi:hypothetical protein